MPTTSAFRLKYGIDQCVGDTICAGGILYGQRNIPVILDFCKDIREVAEPGAKFLNYANPMAMNTWAAIEYGKVDTVGLCHGVQHGAEQIAEILGAKSHGELDYICSGINHQTWFVDLRLNGRKIGKDELVAAFEAHPVYSQQEKLRIDVLKRFGVYSTESNGHLSEYLPWYRKRPDEITHWIDMSDWIHGETGGYLRYSTENRNWFETEFPQFLEARRKADRSRQALQRACQPHSRSAGDRTASIAAISTSRTTASSPTCRRTRSSSRPASSIASASTWSPASRCRKPAPPPAFPRSTSSACRCMRPSAGDIDLLKLAVLHDPLVGAISTPEEVWQMVDEMVVAQARWLPQYAACRRRPPRSG